MLKCKPDAWQCAAVRHTVYTKSLNTAAIISVYMYSKAARVLHAALFQTVQCNALRLDEV